MLYSAGVYTTGKGSEELGRWQVFRWVLCHEDGRHVLSHVHRLGSSTGQDAVRGFPRTVSKRTEQTASICWLTAKRSESLGPVV